MLAWTAVPNAVAVKGGPKEHWGARGVIANLLIILSLPFEH